MTPLILFAFNRPHKLMKVIDAINGQSIKPELIVGFIDGHRDQQEQALTQQCLDILKDQNVEIVQRDRNYGCAANIMFGIQEIIKQYESFVVLEDDVIPAQHWYESMTIMLDKYATDEKVMSVGSFPSLFNHKLSQYPYDVFATHRFSCWGWGSTAQKFTGVIDQWMEYRNNRTIKFDDIGDIAGSDIKQMIANDHHRTLWDAIVAAVMIQQNKVQMITRTFMSNNIGADIHLSDWQNAYFLLNSTLDSKVPTVFPETSEVTELVQNGTIEYISHQW